MKKSIMIMGAALLVSSSMFSQLRDGGKDGINVFETPKVEKEFKGVKATLGGAFTLGFQSLEHSNLATVNMKTIPSLTNADAASIGKYDVNKLVGIAPGFNNASANLGINVALADGVDLKMELYLSARHHQETWVKGGFIQFNKIPFIKLDLLDDIMKFTTLKMGHMEVNYGDAHFRRTDNGNAMYNPFIENYIMDAFATEIGAEADFNYKGLIAVAGLTTGQIKGDQSAATVGAGLNTAGVNDTVTDGSRRPAFLAKLGYDGKVLNDKLRIRATGSLYYTAGSTGVTLYGGDRGGSHYWGVMDNTLAGSTFTKDNIAFTSGRYNPSFGDKITSLMGNLFLDYKVSDEINVESFTTIETSTGRGKSEATGERNAKQFATDLIIRYDNFFLGGRYNTVKAKQYLAADLIGITAVPSGAPAGADAVAFTGATKGMYDVTVGRIAVSAGWFLTKNVMAKVEYTTQNYGGFLYNDIRHNGSFNGIVAEAVIGF